MNHTVQYSSSRAEVWRTYWRSWAKPRGLWLHHVGIGLAAAAALELARRDGFRPSQFVGVWALASLACVVLLPLWPQLRFKTAVRSLTIDATGFRTTIGRLSGSKSWQEIARIEDTGREILIVGTNGNAMIVPERAFPDGQARQVFLHDATAWHCAHAV